MPFAAEVIQDVGREFIKVGKMIVDYIVHLRRIKREVMMDDNVAEACHWSYSLCKLQRQESRMTRLFNDKTMIIRHGYIVTGKQVRANIGHVLDAYLKHVQKSIPTQNVYGKFFESEQLQRPDQRDLLTQRF